jgi:type I restriction enzyme, S subunit
LTGGRSVKIGDLLELRRTPIPIEAERDYKPIGIRSFGRGMIYYPPMPGSELSKMRYFTFPRNALAISNIKAWEGAISLTADDDADTVASSRFLFYLARSSEVNIRFLYYYFLSDRGLRQVGQASPGSADRNRTLSIRSFENIELELPDIAEQRQIAAKLDALMTQAQSIASRVPAESLARVLAAAGTAEVLERFADGLIPVGDVCKIVNDLVRPGDDPGPASDFIGLEHIAPHYGVRTGSRPVGDEKGRKFRFAPGDVLYGYLRPYLNKVWVADRHGLCSVEQYVLRPSADYSANLIADCLRSRTVLDQAIAATNNLQLPRLRSGLLMSLKIPFIPLSRRGEADRILNDYSSRIREYVELQRHRYELVRALRGSLLNAAFSGQL